MKRKIVSIIVLVVSLFALFGCTTIQQSYFTENTTGIKETTSYTISSAKYMVETDKYLYFANNYSIVGDTLFLETCWEKPIGKIFSTFYANPIWIGGSWILKRNPYYGE